MKLPSLLAALGLLLSPILTQGAITVDSGTVNVLTGTPVVNFATVGTTDWLAMELLGGGGAPVVRDEKAGASDLNYVGSTGLPGGGSEDNFTVQWSGGTNVGTFDGPAGFYLYTNQSVTQTFTAAIKSGERSTISFYSNSWVYNNANFTVKDASGTVLTTLALPFGFNTRSSIVVSYTADADETVTFEFSLGGGSDQQLRRLCKLT